MSLTLLVLLDFLFGLILYLLLQRFVRSARMVVTAVLMVLLAAFVGIVQNQEAVSYRWNFFSASWPSFFGKHQLKVSDTADHESVEERGAWRRGIRRGAPGPEGGLARVVPAGRRLSAVVPELGSCGRVDGSVALRRGRARGARHAGRGA